MRPYISIYFDFWSFLLPQQRKTILPASRPVLVILPLHLIEQLDKAADALGFSRSDVIRRSLFRDLAVLREEVIRNRRQIR